MRLTDLDPRWVGSGGEGISDAAGQPVPSRERIGVSFECPCGSDECPRVFIPFENPADGGPSTHPGHSWTRQGDTFDALDLSPSIQRVGGCQWHGYVRSGQIVGA